MWLSDPCTTHSQFDTYHDKCIRADTSQEAVVGTARETQHGTSGLRQSPLPMTRTFADSSSGKVSSPEADARHEVPQAQALREILEATKVSLHVEFIGVDS